MVRLQQYLSRVCLYLLGLGVLVLPSLGQTAQELDARLVSANTRFGFSLFREIIRQDTDKNIFISPSSVAMALAMTYNGASGETRQAMADALKLEGMSLSEVNRANAKLMAMLEDPDPRVQLNIANSLWAREGIRFKPDFLKRNEKFYGARVTTLNFADPDAESIINSWVSEKTKGKIDKIVENIDPMAIMFLINAIYFKGNWTVEFDEEKTRDRPFYLLDGTEKKHPMMSQSGDYRYYRGDRFQAVRLPYGDNKRIGMYIFLPDKDSDIREFLQNLTAENWENWMAGFRMMEGNIVLPRFRLEYEINLNDALKALGMEIAFDMARADFTDMCEIPHGLNVFINKVKHKTFIEVNEEGTEAAAVTCVGIGITAIREKFSMIVDRPFFFGITDDETGTILFIGAIVEPE
ncbi:serpin family protein [candidate division WOR-3 bacterium]|nr:serpin family protein [candidate division WOR-3 bacterium]